jgi:hypothetical protein
MGLTPPSRVREEVGAKRAKDASVAWLGGEGGGGSEREGCRREGTRGRRQRREGGGSGGSERDDERGWHAAPAGQHENEEHGIRPAELAYENGGKNLMLGFRRGAYHHRRHGSVPEKELGFVARWSQVNKFDGFGLHQILKFW